MIKYYYHGSKLLIKDHLEPRSSAVINGQKAVFATNKISMAMFFASGAPESMIEVGSMGNELERFYYLRETKPNAFEKFFKGIFYLYVLDPNNFNPDQRIQPTEFISNQPVKILKTYRIKNLYSSLKKSDLVLITWDDYENILFDFLLKNQKNSNKIKYK